jgi:uncharacterized membrane protein YidH (DUF202 family)
MNGPSSRVRRAVAWAVETEGSTRSAALIRIGVALLLWARWGAELRLFEDRSPAGIALALNFFAATTLMLAGLATRLATAWAAGVVLVLYYYFGVHLGRAGWAQHHAYLLAIGTLLCALTPCGRSYSVDRWRAVRRAERRGEPPPPERGNLWGLRLIACQLSLVYLWSAYDKSNWGFLSGDRMELILMWYYFGSDYPRLPGFHALAALAAIATVALEYALGAGMLFARTRRWLVLPGLALHGVFYLALPVSTYSATVWCLYLAYFEADAVHRAIDRLGGAARTSTGESCPI